MSDGIEMKDIREAAQSAEEAWPERESDIERCIHFVGFLTSRIEKSDPATAARLSRLLHPEGSKS